MRKIFFVFCLLVFYSSVPGFAVEDVGEEFVMYVGQNKSISVENPTRVVIGNPGVADVTGVTKEEVVITPKAPGTTSLVIQDIFGEQSYNIKVFAENVKELKRRIDNILKSLDISEVYTQAIEEEGKLMLLGSVKTPQERERIAVALGALKDKAVDLIVVKEEEAIVEIDVQVLELNKDATKTLGFTMPASVSVTEPTSILNKNDKLARTFNSIFRVFEWQRTVAFTAQVDALVQEGKARILSRPRLACQSGKEAELLVGGEKPTFTTSAASTVTSSTNVEYKEFGIKLNIKPTVTGDSRIKLALNVEVSTVGDAETIGDPNAPTAKAYPLSKRAASTELFLSDGQTMAIGGLMKQKSEEDVRKTFLLGDIPVVGMLFRKKTTKVGGGQGERGDTELFIILTPKIVGNEKPAKQIAKEISIDKSLNDPIARYSRIIQQRILEHLVYPQAAKDSGMQGSVKLRLHLSYQGELLEASVKNSSGFPALDTEALRTAQGITSYPPFPAAVNLKDMWLDIPVVYELD